MEVFGTLESGSAVDTLRISKRQWRDLLKQIDTQATSPFARQEASDNNKRVSKRHAYNTILGLMIQVVHPGGTSSYYLAKPRNLSTTGISFLHGTYLHPGTTTVIQLITLEKETVQIPGVVVRCRHVSGKAHEVGVKFDQQINPADFTARAVGENEPEDDAEPSSG